MTVRGFILTGLLLTLLVGGATYAQGSPADTVASLPGIEITTSVDRAEAYVGDLITYIVTIRYDSTYELVPPPLGANLGSFDVKDYKTDIITKLDKGRLQSENRFKLSTFTTGQYMIPPIPIQFKLPSGERKVLLSEPVPINIQSLILNAGDTADFRPLKAQYQFERDVSRYYIWGGVGLLLLLLSAFLIWWQIKRRREHGEAVDLRPPWEIAFEKLAMLQQKPLLVEKQYKQFYFELTEIARDFLGRMYSVNVLDLTTTEFRERFEKITLPDGVFERTMTLFNHADLVKFARMEPEVDRPDEDLTQAHSIVEAVRAEYVRKQEEEKRRQENKRRDTAEVSR